MEFWPDRRVIELLIGESLYTSADSAIRELLQNAEDACQLQKIKLADLHPEITVRYSLSGNWVEVEDNGYGMNEEIINKSFSSVAASKDNVDEIKALTEKSSEVPIAEFGIGILSCFGVAEKIEVHTKTDHNSPISFLIHKWDQKFEMIHPAREIAGTSIKLYLKPNGPMAADQVPGVVKRYVRHVAHVSLNDVDSNQQEMVQDQWIDGIAGPN